MVIKSKGNLRDLSIKLILISFGASIPLLFADIYFKLNQLPVIKNRLLVLTQKGLETDSQVGIRKFQPNTKYRQAAVYGNKIEFDYFFDTDEIGFRKTYNCSLPSETYKYTLSITGDSFTEGQGSNFVWISTIQDQFCSKGIKSYNTSMAGYGLEDMKKALFYTKDTLDANIAIVAFIPDDISRARVPIKRTEECSNIIKNGKFLPCSLGSPRWHISNSMTSSDLISFARSKYQTGLIPVLKTIIPANLKEFLKRRLDKTYDSYFSSDIDKQTTQFDLSVKSAKMIINKFGNQNTLFIILPTKVEAKVGKTDQSVLSNNNSMVSSFIEQLHPKPNIVDVRSCKLTKNDFFELDGHLNELGHHKLSKCVLQDQSFIQFVSSQSFSNSL